MFRLSPHQPLCHGNHATDSCGKVGFILYQMAEAVTIVRIRFRCCGCIHDRYSINSTVIGMPLCVATTSVRPSPIGTLTVTGSITDVGVTLFILDQYRGLQVGGRLCSTVNSTLS